jgi:acyl carrier protein
MTREEISNELNSIFDRLFGGYYGKPEERKHTNMNISIESESGVQLVDKEISAAAKIIPPAVGAMTGLLAREKQMRPDDYLLSDALYDDFDYHDDDEEDDNDYEDYESLGEKQENLINTILEEFDVVIIQSNLERMQTFGDLVNHIGAKG